MGVGTIRKLSFLISVGPEQRLPGEKSQINGVEPGHLI